MKTRAMQYCLRIPRDAYEDALDIARVFDMSLNQFFLQAIRSYVEAQKKQEVIRSAVAKSREARRAGLANVSDAEVAES
jgi:hypothetical protein